jgi:cytoskeletal protein CcmA (bactofilin family)
MFKRKPTSQPRIDTLIGPGTKLHGDLDFDGGLHLDGQITGNVRAPKGKGAVLSVSEHGCIEGSVEVPIVILNGTVKGDILSAERVELGATARVHGNVHYATIETAVGAQITGKLIHDVAGATKGRDAGPKS